MLLHDDSYADIFNNLIALGVVTDHRRDAEEYVRRLHARTAAILRSVKPRKRKPSVFVVLGTGPDLHRRPGLLHRHADRAGGRPERRRRRQRAVRPLQRGGARCAPARRADRRPGHPPERVLGRAPWTALRAVREHHLYLLPDAAILERPRAPLQRRARLACRDARAGVDVNQDRRLYPTGPAAQRALVVAVDLQEPQASARARVGRIHRARQSRRRGGSR